MQKTVIGQDPFGQDIFHEKWVDVPGVLVGEPSTNEIITDINLYGKRLAYTLGIPKKDNHKWKDTKVKFWGYVFETYGLPTRGIDENIPMKWNEKVKVTYYGKDEN